MRRIFLVAACLLIFALAGPVSAAQPDHQRFSFTTDPYVLAECEGYDVVEQDEVELAIVTYFDRSGDVVRDVFHSATTGIAWRTDTGAQLATYRDNGGTFTATSIGTFTFTGVHNEWTLGDGTVIRDVGRVVVAEVAPGDFERIFDAGQFPEVDPCTW